MPLPADESERLWRVALEQLTRARELLDRVERVCARLEGQAELTAELRAEVRQLRHDVDRLQDADRESVAELGAIRGRLESETEVTVPAVPHPAPPRDAVARPSLGPVKALATWGMPAVALGVTLAVLAIVAAVARSCGLELPVAPLPAMGGVLPDAGHD